MNHTPEQLARLKRTGCDPTEVYVEPSVGSTYRRAGEYSVYGYGTYGRGSVLEGQTRRVWLAGGFTSPEAAQKAWPGASLSESRYEPPYLGHLSEGDDE